LLMSIVALQFGDVRRNKMCECSDDSLSWEYFIMEKVVWDECEVYFHDEIEEMSEYLNVDVFFLSSTLAQHHMLLRWIGCLCNQMLKM
jgi:hypothetical protein